MRNFRIYLIALGALALSGGSILLTVSPASTAQTSGKDVVVQNTTANPVPVAVQGTTNIAGNIGINSTSANPVLVRDVENPARLAFQNQIAFVVGPYDIGACATLATVPTGKRLVIEYVSSRLNPGTFARITTVKLHSILNGMEAFHELRVTPTEDPSDYRVAQEVRIYADPGVVELCVPGVTPNEHVNDVATISGYLIDAP